MSGQGAVGVVVSLIQVLSATASVWGTTPETVAIALQDGAAEERSAFIFFAISTGFFVSVTGALAWLTAMPAYKAVIAPFEQRQRRLQSQVSGDSSETQGLVSSNRISEGKGQIMRIAKANITYEIAVAYTFIVTLVRAARLQQNRSNFPRCSPYSLP